MSLGNVDKGILRLQERYCGQKVSFIYKNSDYLGNLCY